jgi:hypothetical protein
MSQASLINPFTHWPCTDQKKTRKKITDPIDGIHFFFRKVKIPVQAILLEQLSHQDVPTVFLFGSPHIDNYTRTHLGCGLIDFDRAIYGPYFSDLAYALLSMSLKQKVDYTQTLDVHIAQKLFEAYLQGLTQPDLPIPVVPLLADRILEPWQLDGRAYLDAKKGWVKKAYKNPLPKDHPMLQELLRQFFKNSDGNETVEDQELLHVGYGQGSMGRDHYIYLIQNSHQIRVLDIKPAKDYRTHLWPHGIYYQHPFKHEGERMIFATETLAPHMRDLESTAYLNGIQYWGRVVPFTQCKIKELLDHDSLLQFAQAAGIQMGQGHARTASSLEEITLHLERHQDQLMTCVQQMHQQIVDAWHFYCKIR